MCVCVCVCSWFSCICSIDEICVLVQTESKPTTSYLWVLVERAKRRARAPAVACIPVSSTFSRSCTRSSITRVLVNEADMTGVGKIMRDRMRIFLDDYFGEPSEFEHIAMMLVSPEVTYACA